MEVQLSDMVLNDLVKKSGQTQLQPKSLSGADQADSGMGMGKMSGESGTRSSSHDQANASLRNFERTLNQRLDSQKRAEQAVQEKERQAVPNGRAEDTVYLAPSPKAFSPEKSPLPSKTMALKTPSGGPSQGGPKAEEADQESSNAQGMSKGKTPREQVKGTTGADDIHAQVLTAAKLSAPTPETETTAKEGAKAKVPPIKQDSTKESPVTQRDHPNSEQAAGDALPLAEMVHHMKQIQTPTLSDKVLKAPVKSQGMAVSETKSPSAEVVPQKLETSMPNGQGISGQVTSKHGLVRDATALPVIETSNAGQSMPTTTKGMPQQTTRVTRPMQADQPLVTPLSQAQIQAQAHAEKISQVVDRKMTSVGQPTQELRVVDRTIVEGQTKQIKQANQVREGILEGSSSQPAKPVMTPTRANGIDIHALNMQSVLPTARKELSLSQRTSESKADAPATTREAAAPELLGRQEGGRVFEARGDTGKPFQAMKMRVQAEVSVTQGNEQTTVSAETRSTHASDPLILSSPVENSASDMSLSTAGQIRGASSPLPMASSANDPVQSVSQQIMESVHSSIQQGQSRLTIELHPAELGRVFIKFEEVDGQIIGHLEVTERQTRAEINQALPDIVHSLQDSGIQIRRLDVAMSNDSQHNEPKDQSWQAAQEDPSGQQRRQGNEQWPGRSVDYDYDMSSYEPAFNEFTESGQLNRAGSGSIDMLV